MREECAALAKRVKEEYEQRAAAQNELDALAAQIDGSVVSAQKVAKNLYDTKAISWVGADQK